jgi:hypothetical protein
MKEQRSNIIEQREGEEEGDEDGDKLREQLRVGNHVHC